MISLQNIAYAHPNKNILFEYLNLVVNKQEKIALIGNNGAGKSTLLKIIAGKLLPSVGMVTADVPPYYIPQHFGQFNKETVASALGIHQQLSALHEILSGNVTATNMTLLNDDWGIEERCREALSQWGLASVQLTQKMETLSGGQKTKVFLSGLTIHQPKIVLLDEPTNHLDFQSREVLYEYIRSTAATLVVVSHDRTLLNLLNVVCELSHNGISTYGGNYDFFIAQKEIAANALSEDLRSKEKALRKAKDVERESAERQQKLDARGRKKQEKAGVPTIALNTLRNNAEKSTARMKDIHAGKIGSIAEDVNQLRKELPDKDKMKMAFDDAMLHRGKILVTATDVNFGYHDHLLWNTPLNFQIISGQRVAIKGTNGSGKSTLIKMILGAMQPTIGSMQVAEAHAIYIDQEYSLIDNSCSVFEQAQHYNSAHLEDHEIKRKLTHFLFGIDDWAKQCGQLSGGEKMRLILCCLTIGNRAPDMIILDEPTNNLDIQNLEILTIAISEYQGTLIIVSHDAYFLQQTGVRESLELT